MRKIIATAAVALMMLGGGSAALAHGHGGGPPFGGPNGFNPDHPAWYGLCTAYYNNSDQGKQNGAPFQALEEEFNDGEGGVDEEALDEFCQTRRPGNRGDADNSNAPNPGPRGNR